MKRLFLFSICSSGLVLMGLLTMASYAVRELIAALVMFSMGFAALFLIAVAGVLVHNGAYQATTWLQVRVPQWDRSGREWMNEFSDSLQRRRWWTRRARIVNPAALPTETDLRSAGV